MGNHYWSSLSYHWHHVSCPWLMLTVDERKYTANSLLMLTFTGWIVGAFLLVVAIYSFWTALVLKSLLLDPRPWTRNMWSDLRKSADNILVNNGVRKESLVSQFQRMNKDQQENMIQYKIVADPDTEMTIKV